MLQLLKPKDRGRLEKERFEHYRTLVHGLLLLWSFHQHGATENGASEDDDDDNGFC
jgi:hypothetical protein